MQRQLSSSPAWRFVLVLSGMAIVSAGVASADQPGTDGGPADRECRPVLEGAYHVGATEMACSKARRVAKRAIRGNPKSNKWRCTGIGASFGHCHGRGPRHGKIAHWAVAASAGAQPSTGMVLVSTTGDLSERVQTLDIAAGPGQNQQVVMSLPLSSLRSGDGLRISSELEVTTDCLEQSDRCVGNPYDYNPLVATQLVMASAPDTTSGTPISDLQEQRCRQQLPNRHHHCVPVFRAGDAGNPAFTVPSGPLACPLDLCYVNLVASAYSNRVPSPVQPGDKLLVGEDEPDGSIVQDKGRINAVRLRPAGTAGGKTSTSTAPVTTSLPVDDSLGTHRSVVFSQRLDDLKKDEQLAVSSDMQTDIAHLPYSVLLKSRLILTSNSAQTTVSDAAKSASILEGQITEANGFNCTHEPQSSPSRPWDDPCLTQKVGMSRLIADATQPLFVNLVVETEAKRATPEPGDTVQVTGGSLQVVRYPASMKG